MRCKIPIKVTRLPLTQQVHLKTWTQALRLRIVCPWQSPGLDEDEETRRHSGYARLTRRDGFKVRDFRAVSFTVR